MKEILSQLTKLSPFRVADRLLAHLSHQRAHFVAYWQYFLVFQRKEISDRPVPVGSEDREERLFLKKEVTPNLPGDCLRKLIKSSLNTSLRRIGRRVA